MTMCNPGTALGQLHQDLQRTNQKNKDEMSEMAGRLARLERAMREIRSLVNGICFTQKTTAEQLTEEQIDDRH